MVTMAASMTMVAGTKLAHRLFFFMVDSPCSRFMV